MVDLAFAAGQDGEGESPAHGRLRAVCHGLLGQPETGHPCSGPSSPLVRHRHLRILLERWKERNPSKG